MKGVGRIAANAISLWFVATDFRTIYNSRNYSPSDFTALFAPFHDIHITFENNNIPQRMRHPVDSNHRPLQASLQYSTN